MRGKPPQEETAGIKTTPECLKCSKGTRAEGMDERFVELRTQERENAAER
jgi:hypothetical protein